MSCFDNPEQLFLFSNVRMSENMTGAFMTQNFAGKIVFNIYGKSFGMISDYKEA